MPMPPATKTYEAASSRTKWLRGTETVTDWPGRSWVWTKREPPRDEGSSRTPIRYVPRSYGSPHRLYWRM